MHDAAGDDRKRLRGGNAYGVIRSPRRHTRTQTTSLPPVRLLAGSSGLAAKDPVSKRSLTLSQWRE